MGGRHGLAGGLRGGDVRLLLLARVGVPEGQVLVAPQDDRRLDGGIGGIGEEVDVAAATDAIENRCTTWV